MVATGAGKGGSVSAISAAAMTVRTMADGSLRITVEVEPQDAQQAFALFGKPGAPMALAALAVGHAAAQEPEKPKGGQRAQWCAIRCQEPEFQQWLRVNFPVSAHEAEGTGRWGSDAAAWIVRNVCEVVSRAELDTDPEAARLFDELIRRPWMERA